MGEWMDGWVTRWMHGWIGGWVDGWISDTSDTFSWTGQEKREARIGLA